MSRLRTHLKVPGDPETENQQAYDPERLFRLANARRKTTTRPTGTANIRAYTSTLAATSMNRNSAVCIAVDSLTPEPNLEAGHSIRTTALEFLFSTPPTSMTTAFARPTKAPMSAANRTG